jgi:transcriptional regulator with XRE-family HTH domain
MTTQEDRQIGRRVRRAAQERPACRSGELSSAGVSYAYISRIEAGARRPSVKALRQLAPRLGVTVHYLETGEEDPRDVLLDLAARVTAAMFNRTGDDAYDAGAELDAQLERAGFIHGVDNGRTFDDARTTREEVTR